MISLSMLSTKKIMQALLWHYRFWFRWIYILQSLIIAVLVSFWGIQRTGFYSGLNTNSGEDRFTIFMQATFAGLRSGDVSLQALLVPLTLSVIFFYGISHFTHSTLSANLSSLLPRLGQRLTWWYSQLAVPFILCIGYVLINLIIAATIALLSISLTDLNFPTTHLISSYMGLFSGLYISSYLALGSLQLYIGVITKQPTLAFLLTTLIIVLSWFTGGIVPSLDPFLPGSHMLLARHNILDETASLSFQGSIAYNLTILIATCLLSSRSIRRLDWLDYPGK